MAKVIAIAQPENESERKAIAFLRDNLPDSYTLIHNFEILHNRRKYEIDIALIAPHSVFIIDVKHIAGLIDIYGRTWHLEGRGSYPSPLLKFRQHSRILKTLIGETHPANVALRKLYTHAVILMTAPNTQVIDHGGFDGDDITYLNQTCLTYFKGKTHIPSNFASDIRTLHPLIEQAIVGKANPKSGLPCYRDWQIEEELGGVPETYTEYRAKNVFIGKRAGTARLRVYEVDAYDEPREKETQLKLISNAFRSVTNMPGHPNILTVREFFANETSDRFILVTEDISGETLRQHIHKQSLALTFDQKLGIIRDVLTALDHAHKYEVIHRNLTPDAILVNADGHARLTAFDYARVGKSRSSTIALEIVHQLDPIFQAPECYQDPTQASIASDLFSAGLVFYELLTGEPAFEKPEQVFDRDAIFPETPSHYKPDLPSGIDQWLQKLCAFDPEERFPSAAVAVSQLASLITPGTPAPEATPASVIPSLTTTLPNLNDLARDYVIDDRFVVRQRLGKPGGFGVAYRVFDTLGDVEQVIKLITHDKQSVYERLRQEYKTLLQVPDHPHVVKVVWAGRLSDDTPYIVFEYINGLDVEKLLEEEALSLEDAKKIAEQTAAGLAHLHLHGIYHQDIKPSNLLLTDRGIRIIDFNVAVSDQDEAGLAGGTRRYLPPDFDWNRRAEDITSGEKCDRDLYALGITIYECITGRYPFAEGKPVPNKDPINPLDLSNGTDLSPEWVTVMLKAIAPHRSDRFSSAEEFRQALQKIPIRRPTKPLVQNITESLPPILISSANNKPNFNPFVSHLLTLYSQSQVTNAGTRGLDEIGELTYVPTLLDSNLQTDILAGAFSLVLISGNAGDGKTAFIQKMEKSIQAAQVQIQRRLNGSSFQYQGRFFYTNYDGSQDEGEKVNDQVLLEFLGAFQGIDAQTWPTHETRIIAINEGRLVDFLSQHMVLFPRLLQIVQAGLKGSDAEDGVVILNLNLRSVVADIVAENQTSIFDRLIRSMTESRFWEACERCDLKDRCYIHHNARTFMDAKVGSRIINRLKSLYNITHLRGRLHITLRDLRSALAFMLVGTQDCEGVHNLYRSTNLNARQQILDGFYFNAWMGGSQGSSDRLISLLREIDVGETVAPDLDRTFAFLEPKAREMGRFTCSGRGAYDDDLFHKVFEGLPREYTGQVSTLRFHPYQTYISMLRRRYYFERRDEGWKQMLPYRSFEQFLNLVQGKTELEPEVNCFLLAINRGEGLRDPSRLGHYLALRVRQVEKGTIRSYRLFDGTKFSLNLSCLGSVNRFIEFLPQTLKLRYHSSNTHHAELNITLDIYEMLNRLNLGYRPSVEEQQGFYRSLAVFKNLLASAPYQEVLLTETGHEFYRIRRDGDGNLWLEKVQEKS
jgi:serine/threonine protein kinase